MKTLTDRLADLEKRLAALEGEKAEPVEAEEPDYTCLLCGQDARYPSCPHTARDITAAANRRIKAAHREALESAAQSLECAAPAFVGDWPNAYRSAASVVRDHVVEPKP